MASFHWDTTFETELASIDKQHFHLVELINQLGELVTSENLRKADLESLYQELVEYTRYHFEEEEQVMAEGGVDPRHFASHTNRHKEFLSQISQLYQSPEAPEQVLSCAKQLLDFFVHWLAYHILGTDLNMARQVKAIQAGASPESAYEEMEHQEERATEPLLIALNGLFAQVSARNKELELLNLSLEKKVAERTQELIALNQHLEELSLTDSLTGLPNRRHALRHLADVWTEANELNLPLSCMMIDADHFKQINDTYGHDAGDKVLCALGACLQEAVRTDDLVARLGGDEFLIICPNTNLDGALHLARQVHKEVNSLHVPVGSEHWHGSISVGVAERNLEMKHFEALLKRADVQVYQAKNAGKNCVRSPCFNKEAETQT